MPMLVLPRYLRVETHMRASHVYHAARQQRFDFYMFPHRNSILFFTCFGPILLTKLRSKIDQNLPKKHHFSSGVLFVATMGPISTPKVDQKGSILRPLASKKDPKEPLWHPKGAQRSHCEGFGRLKWCPKAHFDGFGVPRCPQKLHFYDTDAPNWPQGPHFEGFGPQFVYSNVWFWVFLCDFFSAFTVFVWFFVLRCCRCSHPAQASGANPDTTSRSQQQQQNKCYQQKPASSAEPASPAKPDTASIIGTTRRTQQNQRYQQKPVLPAESVSLAEASRNSNNWQKQTSPAENPRRTSIKTRSQHH